MHFIRNYHCHYLQSDISIKLLNPEIYLDNLQYSKVYFLSYTNHRVSVTESVSKTKYQP